MARCLRITLMVDTVEYDGCGGPIIEIDEPPVYDPERWICAPGDASARRFERDRIIEELQAQLEKQIAGKPWPA